MNLVTPQEQQPSLEEEIVRWALLSMLEPAARAYMAFQSGTSHDVLAVDRWHTCCQEAANYGYTVCASQGGGFALLAPVKRPDLFVYHDGREVVEQVTSLFATSFSLERYKRHAGLFVREVLKEAPDFPVHALRQDILLDEEKAL